MVEVLICGGGPAGAIAALSLARRGVRVLLVDRAVFPRDKLCGDTLNPGALSELRAFGLDEGLRRGSMALRGMRVTGEGLDIDADYPGGLTGLGLSRRDLDAALIEAAAAGGAHVQQGVRVRAPLLDEGERRPTVRGAILDWRGKTQRMPAIVTIAADGRRSTLGFATGLLRHPPSPRRWAIGAYVEGAEGLGPRGEMHIRRDHYIGIAPLVGGRSNVCVVSSLDGGMRDPETFLKGALNRDPELAARFAHARIDSAVTSMGPLAVDASSAGLPGLLLAGDAAGFVDPITGDGVRLALRGGVLAADVAFAMLEQPHLRGHARLAHLRAGDIGSKMRADRVLRHLVGSQAAIRLGALAVRVAPSLMRWLVTFSGDVAHAGAPTSPAAHGDVA
jgi:flavin-dependent dehydrogenase